MARPVREQARPSYSPARTHGMCIPRFTRADTRSEAPTAGPTASPTIGATVCGELDEGSPSGTYSLTGVQGIPRVYCERSFDPALLRSCVTGPNLPRTAWARSSGVKAS